MEEQHVFLHVDAELLGQGQVNLGHRSYRGTFTTGLLLVEPLISY